MQKQQNAEEKEPNKRIEVIFIPVESFISSTWDTGIHDRESKIKPGSMVIINKRKNMKFNQDRYSIVN